MKSLLLIATLWISSTAFAAANSNAKEACIAQFKQGTMKTYEGTNAVSIRMSSRVATVEFPAKDANLVLMEISANFFVQWPGNSTEARELGGGRYVYDIKAQSCQSVGIIDFGKLKKR